MDMYTLIDDFGKQLHSAVEIAKNVHIQFDRPINNILISGLGGSGIGGTIAAEFAEQETKIPITVSKNYFIPGFVNANTLVIISSYSGNTEETINALEIALSRKAKIVCITSGGKIEEIAKQNELDLILIPGGMPPRTCLGYSMTQVFQVLHLAGAIAGSLLNEINDAANFIISNKTSIQQNGRNIAAFLFNKIPVIYATAYNEGIAIRWRQQINENGKMLCWHHVIPEMNHNELVGWKKNTDQIAVLFFRFDDEYARNSSRIELNKNIIGQYAKNMLDVPAKGSTKIQKLIYMIHLGDWVSYYLSDLNEVDPIEVNVINYLKGELSKISK